MHNRCLHRYDSNDSCALPGLPAHDTVSAETLRPLSHADQAKATLSIWQSNRPESPTVVADTQLHVLFSAEQFNIHLSCFCMLQNVRQSFFADPQDFMPHFPGQRAAFLLKRKHQRNGSRCKKLLSKK